MVTLMSSNCTSSATVLRLSVVAVIANAVAVVVSIWISVIDCEDDNYYRQESDSRKYLDRLNSHIWWQT